MKTGKWAAAALMTTLLAACGTTPQPTVSPYRTQAIGMDGGMSLPSGGGAGTYSDSYNVYGGTAYTADRATDNDPNTEWASRDGATSATLSLAMPQRYRFTAVQIKAQPTQGSNYVIEASDDGSNWTQISGVLSARDWKTETRPVQGSGRYIRVRWMKLDSNLRHWSIFDIKPIGSPILSGGGDTGGSPG